MSEPKTTNGFDDAGFHKYMDELPDLLTGEGVCEEDGVHLDGSFCDWAPELKAVVQTASDGRRYILELHDGQLVRVKELVSVGQ